jgi:DtxR family Mn-dependent transcriptional regulator
LKNPNACPHGNPIPSKIKKEGVVKSFPLSYFALNQILRISRILDEESDLLRKLSQVGIEIGAKIRIIEKSLLDGTLIIELNDKKIPIGEEIAKILRVVPEIEDVA